MQLLIYPNVQQCNLSIPKLKQCNCWILGMDKWFHPTLYNGCNYLSMLGLKLNHVSKRGPMELRAWMNRWHLHEMDKCDLLMIILYFHRYDTNLYIITSMESFIQYLTSTVQISLKFIPRGQINTFPSLVQIMVWRRPGDKPLSEPLLASLLTHTYITRPQWVQTIQYMKVKSCLFTRVECVCPSCLLTSPLFTCYHYVTTTQTRQWGKHKSPNTRQVDGDVFNLHIYMRKTCMMM